MAEKAMELGNKKPYNAPFAKGAREAGYTFKGGPYPDQGKIDDVTVVVAQIHEKPADFENEQEVSTNGIDYFKPK